MTSSTCLSVVLRPGVRALTSVVSVLHARAASIDSLDYALQRGQASLCVRGEMTSEEAHLLARQLERRVDVLSAHPRLSSDDSAARRAETCRGAGQP